MRLVKGYKKEIIELYNRSFPANERKDLNYIFQDTTGISDYYAIVEDEFIGMLITLTIKDLCHIIYFAIAPEFQNRGLGTRAISLLNSIVHQRIIVDIEVPDGACSNHEQRIRRKHFYLMNQFNETEVKYRWHQDDYEILCLNGTVTKQEFHLFWKEIEKVDENLIY